MISTTELNLYEYLLIVLDVNFVQFLVAANHRRVFMEIFHCDWLQPKVGQDRRLSRLVDIFK